jgi:ligand-binding SRPBCC domain-containing protein
VFDFFSLAQNLSLLTPPWLEFKMVEAPELRAGALIHYRLRIHGLPARWTTKITEWAPPHRFVDIQLSGPYQLWHHEHVFTAGRDGTTMADTVRYALPFGPLGRLAHWAFVGHDLQHVFDYRAQKMRELFGAEAPRAAESGF